MMFTKICELNNYITFNILSWLALSQCSTPYSDSDDMVIVKSITIQIDTWAG